MPTIHGSNHQGCSVRKGVLRNFDKFTGNHLCQSLFFNKVAGLKRFPVSFAKFLRIPFVIELLWWLLLNPPQPTSKTHLRFSYQMRLYRYHSRGSSVTLPWNFFFFSIIIITRKVKLNLKDIQQSPNYNILYNRGKIKILK